MSIKRLWGFTTAVLAAAASVASPRSPLPAGLVLYRARADREERRIDCGRAPRPRHNPAPSGAEPEELPLLRGHMRVVRRRRSSVIVPVMVSGRNREPGWDDWASKSRRSHS